MRKYYKRHSKIRAIERYNVKLSNADIKEIKNIIKKNKTILSEKKSNSRSRCILEYEGKIYIVIYSRKLKCIVTFLPFKGNIINRMRINQENN